MKVEEDRRRVSWCRASSFILSSSRPKNYGDVIGAHFPLAFFSGMVLLAAWTHPWWGELYPDCAFRSLTEYPCLFCGGTRAFHAMSRGAWTDAFHDNPLAGILFLVVAMVFLWNLVALCSGRVFTRGRWLRPGKAGTKGWWAGLLVLVLANWAYRLVMGLD